MANDDEVNIDEALTDDGIQDAGQENKQGKEQEEVSASSEEEASTEEETSEEEEKEQVQHMIPKSRYDSAQKRARAAESKVQEYEKEQKELAATAASVDKESETLDSRLVDIDRDIEKARLDGDTDKVVALSVDARSIEKEIYQKMADIAAQSAGTKAQESVKLDSLIDVLEDQYDILNPDSENFDAEKIGEILEMQSAFVKNGETPSAAMLKAVGYIMPEQRITDQVAAKRRTNVPKNLKAAKNQAPNSDDTGLNSDSGGKTDQALDLGEMTEAEFDALPEDTLKRLRGDAV